VENTNLGNNLDKAKDILLDAITSVTCTAPKIPIKKVLFLIL